MKGKETFIITLLALFFFSTTSIGYALYGARADINGVATFTKNGSVSITSAIIKDYKNLTNPNNPIVNGTSISFDLNFLVPRTPEALEDDYYVTYTISLLNDSFYDSIFDADSFQINFETDNEDMDVSYYLDGIDLGDVVPSKEAISFDLTIRMVPNNVGSFNISGEGDVGLNEDTESGRLLASIPKNISGDLRGNNARLEIDASIINSYESEKSFNFTVGNSNFYLVDSNGNELSTYTINGNTTNTYPIYLKVRSGARFATNTQSLNIYFEPTDGGQSSMGVVTVTVDKDETLVDVTPPNVSNVSGSLQNNRSILITYTGSDNIGIDHYVIETYKVENGVDSLISTNQTVADETSMLVSGLDDGNYYFKVTAVDTSELTAVSQSATTEYIWTMTVTINMSGGGPNGNYTVDYGNTYQNTLTANNNRSLPSSITVTMGGRTLGNSEYTYSSNNGNVSVPNVTGNLSISGETTSNGCLIKGTKIKLANGKEKKVEDIDYDDLLLVWNYETGKITKEYPIWIEKSKKTNNYWKITFSDKTYINIYGSHAFYNTDINKFVSYQDNNNFHVGTNIMKLVDNKLKQVRVEKIEEIYEEVDYYFVASTRYYNIISNDVITTDGYTELTNLYEFSDKMMWINNKNIDTIDYSYFEDVLPYYMYKGFRVGEFNVLQDNENININDFKEYIKTLIVSSNMLKEPITKNNERYWMVTTSKDKVKNKRKYLVKEGDYYILPKSKNIKYWYSTSENKKYPPGEKVQVWTGMHFEKIK